jgi:hypothetical protein
MSLGRPAHYRRPFLGISQRKNALVAPEAMLLPDPKYLALFPFFGSFSIFAQDILQHLVPGEATD